MDLLIARMIRAAKLDTNLYEEVEADRSAMSQALIVVLLASIAGGLGNGTFFEFSDIIRGIIVSLISWFLWAAITMFIGTRFLPVEQTSADMGELLRTLGFASAPGVIRVIGIIPPLASILAVIASIWMLIAMVVAVKQALDYPNFGRAIGVCLIGWIPYMILINMITSIF